MSELDNPNTGPVSARGYTPVHDLLSALVDQMTTLRVLMECYVNTQVDIEGDIPKQFVRRPDSAIELAKKLKNSRERGGLDTWYQNLMKEAERV